MSRQLLEQHYPTVLNAKQALNQSIQTLQTAAANGQVLSNNVARQQQLAGQLRALQNALADLTQKFDKFKPNASTTELQLWNSRIARVNADARILMQQSQKYIRLTDHNYLFEGKNVRKRDLTNEQDLLMESERLDDSLLLVDQAMLSGRESVSRLIHQNKLLKHGGRRLRTIMQSLGVSQTTIDAIVKRVSADRLIVIGGMALSTLLIYLFYCWFKGISALWFIPKSIRP